MEEIQKYVFPPKEKLPLSRRIKIKVWQILPISVASLESVCFGLMLGWTSPTYPALLAKDTPIPISLDQTAMVAGFLLFGIIFSTPVSKWSPLGNKYGLIGSLILILVGWVLMWRATSIYWLLGSRLVVGFGHGYGSGQLRIYISEMSQGGYKGVFMKLMNMYILIGMIISYSVGPFVSFRNLSVISICITMAVLLLSALLPHSAKESVRFGKEKQASRVLSYIEPYKDPSFEIRKFKDEENYKMESLSFGGVLKKKSLLRDVLVVIFVTFFQQFSGITATLVYAQIIFCEMDYDYPHFLALIYLVFYAIIFMFFSFHLEPMDSKNLLMFSSVLVAIAWWIQVLILYFELNKQLFQYISYFIMLFYAFAYSLGLGVVISKIMHEKLPPESHSAVAQFQIMCHSFFALISTKTFQVLYGIFGLYISFSFLAVVSTLCVFFVLVFVEKDVEEFKS